MNMLQTLKNQLKKTSEEKYKIYAIVDSAIYKSFHNILDIEGEEKIHILLKAPYLHGFEEVAPYLIELDLNNNEITDNLLEAAKGEFWLTFVFSTHHIKTLSSLLKDMIVPYSQTHEKKIVYRFYDPRNIERSLKAYSPYQKKILETELSGFFAYVHQNNSVKKCYLQYKEDTNSISFSEEGPNILTSENIQMLEELRLSEYLKQCVQDLEEIDFSNPFPSRKRDYYQFVSHVYTVAKSFGLDNEKYAFSLMLAWHVRGKNFIREQRVIELLNNNQKDTHSKYQMLMHIAISTMEAYENQKRSNP